MGRTNLLMVRTIDTAGGPIRPPIRHSISGGYRQHRFAVALQIGVALGKADIAFTDLAHRQFDVVFTRFANQLITVLDFHSGCSFLPGNG
jgi:hypothetical protein